MSGNLVFFHVRVSFASLIPLFPLRGPCVFCECLSLTNTRLYRMKRNFMQQQTYLQMCPTNWNINYLVLLFCAFFLLSSVEPRHWTSLYKLLGGHAFKVYPCPRIQQKIFWKVDYNNNIGYLSKVPRCWFSTWALALERYWEEVQSLILSRHWNWPNRLTHSTDCRAGKEALSYLKYFAKVDTSLPPLLWKEGAVRLSQATAFLGCDKCLLFLNFFTHILTWLLVSLLLSGK